MKALLQRVTRASVTVGNDVVGKVGRGLIVFLGVANDDTARDAEYLVQKVTNLRIFADSEGKFNLSALDVHAEMLIVSQFTLLADTRKGRRPSFIDAAPPELADELFVCFVEQARDTGLKVATGRFQAYMQVEIHNDGPVTFMLDSSGKTQE